MRTDRNNKGQFLVGTHYRPHSIFRDKTYLVQEYQIKGVSSRDIAKRFGVTKGAILYWLKFHHICRRDQSEVRKLKTWGVTTGPLTKEELREYYHLLRLAFPEEARVRSLANYHRNPEPSKARNRKWHKDNPEYARAKLKQYRIENPERYKDYDRKRKPHKAAYIKKRRKDDINFRLACNLRGRVNSALRQNNKTGKTLVMLGCSIADFRIYLESKFEVGMTWDNYGRYPGWQIDHIMPCAIYDLTKPEHQKRCFHFSNMQPMWATANQSKNCKVLTAQFPLI